MRRIRKTIRDWKGNKKGKNRGREGKEDEVKA
jgi:hypothetical protein